MDECLERMLRQRPVPHKALPLVPHLPHYFTHRTLTNVQLHDVGVDVKHVVVLLQLGFDGRGCTT